MKSARIILVGAAGVALGLLAWLFLSHGTNEGVSGIESGPADDELQNSTAPSIPSVELAAGQTASERAAATSELLEVLVVDPSGTPVPRAEVILYRPTGWLKQAATGDDGIAAFPPREDAGSYLIAAPGWNYTGGEIDMSAGRRSVSLVEGATVGGRVLLDGRPPSESVELTWKSGSVDAIVAGLSRHVARALRTPRGVRAPISTRTEADGVFRFRGLAADAAGTILWSGPHFLEGNQKEASAQSYEISEPRRDIELRLTIGVELRFRVVNPKGAPIPDAFVSLRRGKSLGQRLPTDAAGRSAFAFLPVATEKFSVDVGDQQEIAARRHELELPAGLRGVWDAGDLATCGSREVTVFARDSEGKPIALAEVETWPRPARSARERTHYDGRAELVVGEDSCEIDVSAFGFEAVRVPVPRDVLEVEATLPNACVLELKLNSEPERGVSSLTVMSGSPLFNDEAADGPNTPKRKLGQVELHRGPVYSSAVLPGNRAGAWILAGLVPGKAIRAQLRADGKVLGTTEIGPMRPGERREMSLGIDVSSKPLTVRVLSPDGQPLARAGVRADNSAQVSNSSGVVQFPRVLGDRCDLSVWAAGFARKAVVLRSIPSGMLDVRLDHPLSVEVEVTHSDGSPVDDRVVLHCDEEDFGTGPITMGGAQVRVTRLTPDRFRVDGLPAEEVTLSVYGEDSWSRKLHDARIPNARIVLGPGSEQIRVMLDGTFLFDDDAWAVAIAETGDPRDLVREPFTSTFTSPDSASATIYGAPMGPHELWLETRSSSFPHDWIRIGTATRVVVGDKKGDRATIKWRVPY